MCLCASECVGLFIKRAPLFGGEMFCTDCSPLKWESRHITHSFLQTPPFIPPSTPPPPLYLSPPVVPRSLDLISLSQAAGPECYLPHWNPSAYTAVGSGRWVRLCSFPASSAIWAIRIQWRQCRATIRACLIEWGQPSGLLRRATQLNNALTHHFSDIFHKCSQ